MGTYRELDPVGAEASDDKMARLLRIREQLKDVSLSHFSVQDLPALVAIQGMAPAAFGGHRDPFPAELDQIEQCLKRIFKVCEKCDDSGLMRRAHGYCDCKKGRRLAEQGMVSGEHGL